MANLIDDKKADENEKASSLYYYYSNAAHENHMILWHQTHSSESTARANQITAPNNIEIVRKSTFFFWKFF